VFGREVASAISLLHSGFDFGRELKRGKLFEKRLDLTNPQGIMVILGNTAVVFLWFTLWKGK
jgi:hypothetical protein